MTDIQIYVQMVKGKTTAAVSAVVKQALSCPGLYFFAELLATPEIQSLSKADNDKDKITFEVLKLFSAGTYADYAKDKERYDPIVTPGMIAKLREITIVQLASKNRSVAYDSVMKATGISDVRELEDLLIDTITHDLLKGKLDQRARVVEVHGVVGRDVSLQDIPSMIAALEKWEKSCEDSLQAINAVQQECITHYERKEARLKDLDEMKKKTIEGIKLSVAENLQKLGGPSAIDEVMAMMVLGEEEAGRMKARKRGMPENRHFMRGPF